MTQVRYPTVDVDGYEIFYREAGDRSRPTLLLLHGFPSSSHMFRDLIPLLADRFHLVAPDLPGFGLSEIKPRGAFDYSFDNLAKVIGRFTEVIGLDRYALYVFDYGAPTGFRLAMAHPERVTAIVSQNGNAYEEGLSEGWDPIQRYWRDPSDANRQALRVPAHPGLDPLAVRARRARRVTGVAGRQRARRLVHPAARGRRDPARPVPRLRHATSRSTPPSRPTSASTSRSCWRSGAATTPSSCRRARRPSGAICPAPRCASSTRATSRLRRMRRRSRRRSPPSSGDDQRRTTPVEPRGFDRQTGGRQRDGPKADRRCQQGTGSRKRPLRNACQSASKFDPLSAFNIDPLAAISGGSGRPAKRVRVAQPGGCGGVTLRPRRGS